MNSFLILLTALTLSSAKMKTGIPVNIHNVNNTEPPKVLQGNVAVEKDLPQEFYGTWAVKSIIIETNNPYLFNQKSIDVWEFSRIGKTITLSNPQTGATASITVNEVVGKKAKFTRRQVSQRREETETPEVIIEGNTFSGSDTLTIKYFRGGEIYKTDVVKYKLEGLKLSGPTINELFAK